MSALVKVGAVSAVVGAALLLVEEIVNPIIGYPETGPADLVMSVLYALHVPLFLFAALGLYLYQQRAAGALGLVGFLLTAVGSLFLAGIVWADLFLFPALAQFAPTLADEPTTGIVVGFILSIAFYALGWLLFAIATLRARVFPRAACIGLLVGVVALLASIADVLPGMGAIFAVAVGWLGLLTLRLLRMGSAGAERREELLTA